MSTDGGACYARVCVDVQRCQLTDGKGRPELSLLDSRALPLGLYGREAVDVDEFSFLWVLAADGQEEIQNITFPSDLG